MTQKTEPLRTDIQLQTHIAKKMDVCDRKRETKEQEPVLAVTISVSVSER